MDKVTYSADSTHVKGISSGLISISVFVPKPEVENHQQYDQCDSR